MAAVTIGAPDGQVVRMQGVKQERRSNETATATANFWVVPWISRRPRQ